VETQNKCDEIVTIIKKYSKKNMEINLESEIYFDLNIYGDDAEELIEEIAKKLAIPMARIDINLSKYCPPEVDLSLVEYLQFLPFVKKKYKKRFESFKVQSLCRYFQNLISS